ncbi:retropepsin-like aspartic protease family protein [Aliidiomarina haloalkalitolerans]|uniref:TIGR02281 family clan AA aspartic protease n=1 Tax=Aliidiomarina haloalkalitolerans TaxID=859059 RepID=A0A432VSW2_9GAMM|nr:TIGR02281 family clan AA aspartic protease [Aliidiomarina haloalkalitolerans]MCL4408828.1 TIGR02281 family clan AA aspartic protease [Gammaproteobacteria bacterium]RUO19502.1 TIGR02281 family clan AA aspartic protease [Aliidiomarina haloalkalitolerans]
MQSDQDTSKTFGRWFNWLAWILLLFVFYWFFSGYLEEQENPNQQVRSYHDGQVAVVELDQNRAGHYLANGRINGRLVTFLLDTGATQVAIPGRMANLLGVEPGPAVQVRTASGIATAYRTEIAELQLGDIRLYNVAATIVPDYDSEHILLGMSALRSLEFTQRDGVLTIRQ